MKRILICLVLLAGAVAVSCYSHFMVERLDEEFNLRIGALISVLNEENTVEMMEQANDLVAFWEEEEKRLVHYVRHSHIDVISMSIARLPALIQYGEYSDAHAELLSILWQMEQIREAEQLSIHNLL